MKYLFLVGAFLMTFGVSAQKAENYTKPAVVPFKKPAFGMTFDTRHIDLGKIKKGDKRSTSFVFTNTGTEDIEIEIVSACECTTLDWPRLPVKPGKQGEISVVFDSSEKDESETIEIDINLKNKEADTGYKRLEIISYSYELIP